MLLTEAERKRFAAYLWQEHESYKGLAEEMRKLNTIPAMIQRNETLSAAAGIMAAHIASFESATIETVEADGREPPCKP